jgi:hypothetical protein
LKPVNIAILFLIIITSPLISQSYLNFPIDTLARDSFYNYRSMVKYDNNGYIHIVNTRQFDTESSTREIFYRTNKTGPIVTTQLTGNSVDDNYATFGFDQQGNVHIGWERRDASNNFQLIYSNNRGGSFITPVWITTGGINKATPFMAVGRGDSLVHFVYYTFATGQDYAYYRWYNYITGQFGPETQLAPAETGSENDIEAAVDGNNRLHIVFSTNVNISGGALKYFTNESGTLTEIPTGLSSNIEYPEMTIDNNNVVHVIYRNYSDKRIYLIRKPSGGALQSPFAITPAGLGNPAYWRAIDTDNNGRLYVTFQNSSSTAPKGFFLVHISGSNASAPILMFEDSTASYVTRGSSSVAAKENGEITVLFDPAGIRFGNVISDIFMKRGMLTFVGVNSEPQIITGYELYDNYPNPFNPVTNISYEIPITSHVKLAIYDALGKELAVIIDKIQKAGKYDIQWDGSNFTSGVYFYKLNAGNYEDVKKMVLVK